MRLRAPGHRALVAIPASRGPGGWAWVVRCFYAHTMNTSARSPFESALLREIANGVEQRGKAIRYHGELECSRVVEDSIERLNVDFTATVGCRVRLSVWPDGALWLGITEPGARRTGGWAYRDEFHSHLDGLDAHSVVERFEQTIHSPTQARGFWPESHDETRNT